MVGHLKTVRFDLDMRDSLGRRLHPDAVIHQEDRDLVMGGQKELDPAVDSDLDAAYRAIIRHRPLPLGRYLVRPPRPSNARWEYQAVVHDLSASPTSRPGDVQRSLVAVLEDAVRRGLRSLASEPLGVWMRAGLDLEGMVDAFGGAILEVSRRLEAPVRLTLLLDDLDELEEVSHLFRSSLLRKATRSFRTVAGDAAVVEVCHDEVRFHCRFVPGTLSGFLVTRVGQVA